MSGSASASFLYDGDGQRFAATINGVTTVYIGEYFEWQPATRQMTKYYFAGGQRIAMRVIPQGQNAAPLWLFGDHLGSTSVVANTDGSQYSRQGYMAWGETRFSVGSLPTKNQYTGQISHEAELGLYFYKARYYNPALSRWMQPDTLVPDPANPLDWDRYRYQYVRSNPIQYVDSSGHEPIYIPGWNDSYMQKQEGSTCAVVSLAVAVSIVRGEKYSQADIQPYFPNTYKNIGVVPLQQTFLGTDTDITVRLTTGTRQDLLENFRNGIPTVVTFALPMEKGAWGHAVVCIGYDPVTEQLQFFDPAKGIKMTEQQLLDEYNRRFSLDIDSFDELWASENLVIAGNQMISIEKENTNFIIFGDSNEMNPWISFGGGGANRPLVIQ